MEKTEKRPCTYLVHEGGKVKLKNPAVDCKKQCRYCGFNPKEQARRMTEGHFVVKNGVRTLTFKTNITLEEALKNA